MAVRSTRTVRRALERKGFVRRDGGHEYYQLVVEGAKTPIFTKVSHGSKEVGSNLIARMARQCRLSKGQFLDLVDCPMTGEEYAALVEFADAASR